ncbi:hypothetical protein DV515_00009307 [Chloebia gouldiae]|uniref:Uncharacterized protein n=1 Tax=Chloebia gouldiae TaxID=44316 RepID=A0A3L8SCC2_CHLGU|nr:hypothetical protein DV515_00009307 [Chloebia gouldiae]
MPSCTARLMSPTLRLRISTMRGVSYSKRKLCKAPQSAMAKAGTGRRPHGASRGCRGPTAPRAARPRSRIDTSRVVSTPTHSCGRIYALRIFATLRHADK